MYVRPKLWTSATIFSPLFYLFTILSIHETIQKKENHAIFWQRKRWINHHSWQSARFHWIFWPKSIIEIFGTVGQIYGTFGQIYGTFGQIYGPFGQIYGTFGQIYGTFGQIYVTFGQNIVHFCPKFKTLLAVIYSTFGQNISHFWPKIWHFWQKKIRTLFSEI